MCASMACVPTTAPLSMQCVEDLWTWRPPWLSCYQIYPWHLGEAGGLHGDARTAAASWQSLYIFTNLYIIFVSMPWIWEIFTMNVEVDCLLWTWNEYFSCRWETEPDYCSTIKKTAPYNKGTRLVDFIDLVILDFLMSKYFLWLLQGYATFNSERSTFLMIKTQRETQNSTLEKHILFMFLWPWSHSFIKCTFLRSFCCSRFRLN